MRRHRAAVAATALGLAGALLPVSSAGAATPDRVFTHDEVVVIRRPDGSTYDCQVHAQLFWHLGDATPEDDALAAFTQIRARPGDALECEFEVHKVATLRWHDVSSNNSYDYTFTAESDKNAEVFAPPAFTDDGAAYEDPSSEHRWVFRNCASNCEFTHTFNPK